MVPFSSIMAMSSESLRAATSLSASTVHASRYERSPKAKMSTRLFFLVFVVVGEREKVWQNMPRRESGALIKVARSLGGSQFFGS